MIIDESHARAIIKRYLKVVQRRQIDGMNQGVHKKSKKNFVRDITNHVSKIGLIIDTEIDGNSTSMTALIDSGALNLGIVMVFLDTKKCSMRTSYPSEYNLDI